MKSRMTLQQFRDETAALPPDTILLVWDMGQGGLVGVDSVDMELGETGFNGKICLNPLNEEASS